MTGSNLTNQAAVYGTMGVAAAGNTPGSRCMATEWTDLNGKFWLFGGMLPNAPLGSAVMNDMWMYDPATNMWTWMTGSTLPTLVGTYGVKGVTSPANTPGSKARALGWVDNNGVLWLYGGSGPGTNGSNSSPNDLWKYDPDPASPTYNQWTWVHGNTIGGPPNYGTVQVSNVTNDPGSRANTACTWTDNSTNSLWFFAGNNRPDVWKYDIATDRWIWMAGSNVAGTAPAYGVMGTPAAANTPGTRSTGVYAGWKDNNGDYWFFGGVNQNMVGIQHYSAVWKFDMNPLRGVLKIKLLINNDITN